jgi:Ni,Fe-hydrogenase I cytochrome b subunit
VKEEHTLAYKFKNGLKNFVYLGYLIMIVGTVFGGLKLYKWGLKTYYKYKISNTPSSNGQELRMYKKLL